MQRRRLGGSGLVVSEICLGTMTFGAQAEESEAFRIMDHAYENGINFLDAAEPVSYTHLTLPTILLV